MATDIIQRAGGDAAVAEALSISHGALRKWREKGRIPPKHWQSMAYMAKTRLDVVASAILAPPPRIRKSRKAS